MRTSCTIKGVLVLTALATGASWLGAGGAVAAVPCGEGTLTSLESPTMVICDQVTDVRAPQVAPQVIAGPYLVPEQDRRGVHGSGGDLIIGIEQVGRSAGPMSGTAAVAGLSDLPAIVRSTGAPRLTRGEFLSEVARRRGGAARYRGGALAPRVATSDVPGVTGPTPGPLVLPVEPPAASAAGYAPDGTSGVTGVTGVTGEDGISVAIGNPPSVRATVTGLRVR